MVDDTADARPLHAVAVETDTSEQADDDTVWSRLSALSAGELGDLVGHEPSAVLAILAMQLEPEPAARLLGVIAPDKAVDVVLKMVEAGPVPAATRETLSRQLGARLDTGRTLTPGGAPRHIAGILDRLDRARSDRVLDRLHTMRPQSAERLRKAMFVFDDLIQLTPFGLQTLLARTDRLVLMTALKQAEPILFTAFVENMTERAGAQFRTEFEAMGMPGRRDIAHARRTVLNEARGLIAAGEVAFDRDARVDDGGA